MKKLSSAANVLYILARIASVCLVVAMSILVIASVLLLGFNNDSMIEFTGLDLGALTFELAEADIPMLKYVFLCEMLPALVLMGYGWLVLRIILQILTPMKNGQPFDGSIADQMKKLCWLTVGGGVCSQLIGAASATLMYKAYDFSTLFLNDHIIGVKLNLEMDMGFVILALIWYMLSCIFRYGEELQKQSDETL